MNKVLKITTTSLVTLLTLCGLTSCNLSKIEENAKSYMKEHKEDFSSFKLDGLGFSYKSDYLSYDFTTDKGTYTSNDYEFKFTSSYDYENDDLSFNITKIINGEEGFGLTLAEAACKIELTAMYVSVELASSLYTNSQEQE